MKTLVEVFVRYIHDQAHSVRMYYDPYKQEFTVDINGEVQVNGDELPDFISALQEAKAMMEESTRHTTHGSYSWPPAAHTSPPPPKRGSEPPTNEA